MVDQDLTKAEVRRLEATFERDLIAAFKLMVEDVLKLVAKGEREGKTPEEIMRAIDELLGPPDTQEELTGVLTGVAKALRDFSAQVEKGKKTQIGDLVNWAGTMYVRVKDQPGAGDKVNFRRLGKTPEGWNKGDKNPFEQQTKQAFEATGTKPETGSAATVGVDIETTDKAPAEQTAAVAEKPKAQSGASVHPADGKTKIAQPSQATGPKTWTDERVAAVFTPGSEVPESINAVEFKEWGPPSDWSKVEGQAKIDEPPLPSLGGLKLSAGVVIEEPDGRLWVVKPTNEFGGYKNTFPKGGVDAGTSPQVGAIREAWEETGLKVKITGYLTDAKGDTSITRFYTAKRTGGTPKAMGWESQAVQLVPRKQVAELLNKARDKEVFAKFEAGKYPDKNKKPAVDVKREAKAGTAQGVGPIGLSRKQLDDFVSTLIPVSINQADGLVSAWLGYKGTPEQIATDMVADMGSILGTTSMPEDDQEDFEYKKKETIIRIADKIEEARNPVAKDKLAATQTTKLTESEMQNLVKNMWSVKPEKAKPFLAGWKSFKGKPEQLAQRMLSDMRPFLKQLDGMTWQQLENHKQLLVSIMAYEIKDANLLAKSYQVTLQDWADRMGATLARVEKGKKSQIGDIVNWAGVLYVRVKDIPGAGDKVNFKRLGKAPQDWKKGDPNPFGKQTEQAFNEAGTKPEAGSNATVGVQIDTEADAEGAESDGTGGDVDSDKGETVNAYEQWPGVAGALADAVGDKWTEKDIKYSLDQLEDYFENGGEASALKFLKDQFKFDEMDAETQKKMQPLFDNAIAIVEQTTMGSGGQTKDEEADAAGDSDAPSGLAQDKKAVAFVSQIVNDHLGAQTAAFLNEHEIGWQQEVLAMDHVADMQAFFQAKIDDLVEQGFLADDAVEAKDIGNIVSDIAGQWGHIMGASTESDEDMPADDAAEDAPASNEWKLAAVANGLGNYKLAILNKTSPDWEKKASDDPETFAAQVGAAFKILYEKNKIPGKVFAEVNMAIKKSQLSKAVKAQLAKAQIAGKTGAGVIANNATVAAKEESPYWSGGEFKPESVKVLKASLGGSTGAKLVEVAMPGGGTLTGVFKMGASQGHAKEEHFANAAYRGGGVGAKRSRLMFDEKGTVGVLGEWVEGKEISSLSGAAKTQAIKEARKGFAMDALLGNWDAARLDNLLWNEEEKKVYRIDNGGALRYRAQGGMKEGFSEDATKDLMSLRNPSIAASDIFAGLTDKEVAEQIKAIDGKSIMDALAKAGASAAATKMVQGRLGSLKSWSDSLTAAQAPPKGLHSGTLVKGGFSKAQIKKLSENKSGTQPNITKVQGDAMVSYKGSGYIPINKHLRERNDLLAKTPLNEKIHLIDNYIAATPVVERELIRSANSAWMKAVFNGLAIPEMKFRTPADANKKFAGTDKTQLDILKAYLVGSTISDLAFGSSTTSKNEQWSFGMDGKQEIGIGEGGNVQVFSKGKCKGADLLNIPNKEFGIESEKEVVLPRGQRYKVHDVQIVSVGMKPVYRLYAELFDPVLEAD